MKKYRMNLKTSTSGWLNKEIVPVLKDESTRTQKRRKKHD